jgi:hypothetical protein
MSSWLLSAATPTRRSVSPKDRKPPAVKCSCRIREAVKRSDRFDQGISRPLSLILREHRHIGVDDRWKLGTSELRAIVTEEKGEFFGSLDFSYR